MTAAHLRMPGRATAEEKEQLVDSLIRRLGLTSCAGSLVGDNKKRGLSGGEKKRLSIAAELIAGPKLLFTGQLHAKVLQAGMAARRCFSKSERRAAPDCGAGCWGLAVGHRSASRGFAAGSKSRSLGGPHERGSFLRPDSCSRGNQVAILAQVFVWPQLLFSQHWEACCWSWGQAPGHRWSS